MKKLFFSFCALIMCSITFAQAPQTGKQYYIGYKNTEFYLGRADENPDKRVSIRDLNEDYAVYLTEVDERPGVYNIRRVLNDDYLYQDGYFVRFAASPAISANVTTNVTLTAAEDEFYTIQWTDKTGNNYLGANGEGNGQNTAADKPATGYVKWRFVEVVESDNLAVKTLSPAADATEVNAINLAISVVFTKSITAGDLSGISIKDEDENAVADVAGSVKFQRLTIAHAELAFGKTYTVTVPAGAIEGYTENIIWSFSTATPVLPQEPRIYRIVNATTGYYLTLPATSPATDSPLNTTSKIEGEGEETQIFRFLSPDPTQPDVFNIAIGNQYITKGAGNAWAITLSSDTTDTYAQFVVIPDGTNIKIQAVNQAIKTQYFAPNNATINVAVYLDKTALTTWKLEQVAEPIALFKNSPADDAPGVALNVPVSATFNQSVTAADLTAITIKNAADVAVADVQATLNDYIIEIAHADFDFNTTYTVTIPVAAIDGLTEPLSWSFTTEAAPAVSSVTPENNATDVAIAANTVIKADFDKDVLAGDLSGVTITANATALEGVQAAVSGQTLTITHPVLDYSTVYTVNIPAAAVKGLSEAYPWSFTTTAAPTVKSTTPADGATNVALTTLIRVTYDKQPIAGSAGLTGVTLKAADGTDITGNVTISGSALVIAKAAGVTLANGTTYTVTVPANTIKGITEPFTYSFTTVGGVGINDVNAGKVSVYPTVSNGQLTIVTPDKASVKVLDISGRTLAGYSSNGNLNIDLNYANGLYIIKVDNNGKVSSHKVILKK
jgi:hypothetical protein